MNIIPYVLSVSQWKFLSLWECLFFSVKNKVYHNYFFFFLSEYLILLFVR